MQGFGYYINGNGGYKSTLPLIKKNYYHVFKELDFILTHAINGKQDEIGGIYRPALLEGTLPYSDKVTGFNTYRLPEKMKFLTIQLSDKKHPENIDRFVNSKFQKVVLSPLFKGYLIEPKQKWLNYKFNENGGDPALKDRPAIEGAIYCQREDMTAPIGINWARVIDAIVGVDENGIFQLVDDFSIEMEVELNHAVHQQLDAYKLNKRFAANYENPLI